jgi:hypothetical protein
MSLAGMLSLLPVGVIPASPSTADSQSLQPAALESPGMLPIGNWVPPLFCVSVHDDPNPGHCLWHQEHQVRVPASTRAWLNTTAGELLLHTAPEAPGSSQTADNFESSFGVAGQTKHHLRAIEAAYLDGRETALVVEAGLSFEYVCLLTPCMLSFPTGPHRSPSCATTCTHAACRAQ